tara:strand:- start:316 stop:525 length:210 start_codon:yes stop_codon:yes gene_type:complete
MEEISPEDRLRGLPALELNQRDGDGWMRRLSGVAPCPAEEADIQKVFKDGTIPPWVTKFFVLRFLEGRA